VYSEAEEENAIEHNRLSQCDRTKIHTEEVKFHKQRTYCGNLHNGNEYILELSVFKMLKYVNIIATAQKPQT
jgi:hypothetical protein